MKYSVDRIEDGLAVLVNEGGDEIKKPLGEFSFEVREGMLLSVGKSCTRRLERKERAAKKRLDGKLKRLIKRGADIRTAKSEGD